MVTEERTVSIKQIPQQTLTQPQCFQITESLFKQMIPVITLHCLLPARPLFFFFPFSVCASALLFLFVWVCLDQEAAFLSEHTNPVDSGAACGSSTLGKLCLNFEAGCVSACPRGCPEHSAPVAHQRGGQTGQVNRKCQHGE